MGKREGIRGIEEVRKKREALAKRGAERLIER